MAEGTSSPLSSERQSERHASDRHAGDGAPRGERASGPREGGFRIRLSDNEMRSARALQEAFGLRSTVAVLGFALRTLGQQLEEGKLEELVAQQRAQVGSRGPAGARPEGGRRERSEGRGPGARWQEGRGSGGRGAARVDPFARPSRPAGPAEPVADGEPLEEIETVVDSDAAITAADGLIATESLVVAETEPVEAAPDPVAEPASEPAAQE